MEQLIERARALAVSAHEGQVDKSGQPYIQHPARVAARVAKQLGTHHPAVAVAWLHDVVEDTTVTMEDIAHHFGDDIAAAVDALTKRKGESPEHYYARVRAHPWALTVKAADIADNTDPQRLALLDAATANRLRAKYATARALLGL